MSTARFYDESKNPDGGHLPGVPLGDIDEATFEGYPDWLKASIDAAPFYRKTKQRAQETAPLKAPVKADKE